MSLLFGSWSGLSLWLNALIFLITAGVIWAAGTKLSRAAAAFSEATGMSQAFIGVLLLGGATSLPEIVTTITAASGGNADLAVSNIMGGIAMQVVILAVADLLIGRRAMSGRVRHPDALLQGALLVFVVAVAVAGMIAGDRLVFGVGLWTSAIFVLVIAGMYLIKAYEKERGWEPTEEHEGEERDAEPPSADRRPSLPRLVIQISLAGVAILVAGYALTRSGEGIADATGLSASFAGAVLIAVATSLPEVSTTFEAVRMSRHMLAFAGIFGTNLFDVSMLLLADVAYAGPPVLTSVSVAAQFTGLLAIACTSVFLVGLVERSEIRLGRAGLDSVVVLAIYAGGLVILYGLDG